MIRLCGVDLECLFFFLIIIVNIKLEIFDVIWIIVFLVKFNILSLLI